MFQKALVTAAAALLIAACTPRPAPPGPDSTLDVTEFSAIRASARDVSDNYNELFQVDVRAPGDPVLCRGE